MSLTDSEVSRCKFETGQNLLTIGAIPYIGITQLWEQVIQPYTNSGAATTSDTTVAAATTATPATLTLASATGFAALSRVVVDVDDRQEIVTVQSVSGSTITVLLKLAHSGTYPVNVEGGETIIREILGRIRTLHSQIKSATSTAGLKRVDTIEFYGNSVATSQISMLRKSLSQERDELARALGVHNYWNDYSSGGQVLSVY